MSPDHADSTAEAANTAKAGPLAGLTVVELGGIGPGPFCGMLLADLGAEVVRIDRPAQAGRAAAPAMLQRGRRSAAVDLKHPAGAQAVLRLIDRADAVLEGFRPGVAERLGLGPEDCLARNPRLVYGRMTGWGQHGPEAQQPGHDINYIALTGALHAIGPADSDPVVPLNLVGDFGGGGMLLAFGMVSALLQVARGGTGQVVDAAMTDGSALLMSMAYGFLGMGAWRDERGVNLLDGGAPFYGVYRCADGGQVALGSLEPPFYAALLAGLGLADDPDFAVQHDRERWPAMRAKLGAAFAAADRDHWAKHFAGTPACVTPVLSLAEAPQHPHNVARSTFLPGPGGAPMPAPAPRFSATPASRPQDAPVTGADTDALLAEAGLPAEEIASLRAQGVIG